MNVFVIAGRFFFLQGRAAYLWSGSVRYLSWFRNYLFRGFIIFLQMSGDMLAMTQLREG